MQSAPGYRAHVLVLMASGVSVWPGRARTSAAGVPVALRCGARSSRKAHKVCRQAPYVSTRDTAYHRSPDRNLGGGSVAREHQGLALARFVTRFLSGSPTLSQSGQAPKLKVPLQPFYGIVGNRIAAPPAVAPNQKPPRQRRAALDISRITPA